jgi:hypothetical protein
MSTGEMQKGGNAAMVMEQPAAAETPLYAQQPIPGVGPEAQAAHEAGLQPAAGVPAESYAQAYASVMPNKGVDFSRVTSANIYTTDITQEERDAYLDNLISRNEKLAKLAFFAMEVGQVRTHGTAEQGEQAAGMLFKAFESVFTPQVVEAKAAESDEVLRFRKYELGPDMTLNVNERDILIGYFAQMATNRKADAEKRAKVEAALAAPVPPAPIEASASAAAQTSKKEAPIPTSEKEPTVDPDDSTGELGPADLPSTREGRVIKTLDRNPKGKNGRRSHQPTSPVDSRPASKDSDGPSKLRQFTNFVREETAKRRKVARS